MTRTRPSPAAVDPVAVLQYALEEALTAVPYLMLDGESRPLPKPMAFQGT